MTDWDTAREGGMEQAMIKTWEEWLERSLQCEVGESVSITVDDTVEIKVCECGTGYGPHEYAGDPLCEQFDHCCDMCHSRKLCTTEKCLAEFAMMKRLRRLQVLPPGDFWMR